MTTAVKVTLKLHIYQTGKKVLFAEVGKDFVDFLLSILSLPVGIVTGALGVEKMVGSLGTLYESIETLNATYLQPKIIKELVLNPRAPSSAVQVPTLLPYNANSSPTNGHQGGYVTGVVRYMVMDDLAVKPLTTVSIIGLMNQYHVKDMGSLEHKVVDVGVEEGLEILRASLQSKTVLSDVFCIKKCL